MNNHPLPETNPSTTHLQRKERTRNANPTSACGPRRPQRIDAPRRPRKRRRGRTHTRRHRSRRRARCRTRALRRTARPPREHRGQHPTQPIHDGGIRDITEQTIGDGHAIGQPGQARPPREHRFVTGQRLVTQSRPDRHDRGDMETQGHRCALQEPGYPVHRHETATENGNEARSVVFHHDRRSIVLGDDIRSIHPRVPQVISGARDGP